MIKPEKSPRPLKNTRKNPRSSLKNHISQSGMKNPISWEKTQGVATLVIICENYELLLIPVMAMKAEASCFPNWLETVQVYIPSSSFWIPVKSISNRCCVGVQPYHIICTITRAHSFPRQNLTNSAMNQIKSDQYSSNWQNTTTDTQTQKWFTSFQSYLMGEEQNKRQDKMNINNRPNTNN